MNFGEIYDAVVFNIWGGAVPPTDAVARLQGSEGIIANMHRDIQIDYNYWFMESWTIVESIAGTQGYAMPDNFKELVNAMWQVIDSIATDPYFTEPLKVWSTKEAHVLGWVNNNQRVEYPTHFEIKDGISLILYPIPEETDRELNVIYTRFLDRPTTVDFSTDTDILTQRGAEAIIALATAKMFRILQEMNMSQVYDGEARRYIELLKREDFNRRQSLLLSVNYSGC